MSSDVNLLIPEFKEKVTELMDSCSQSGYPMKIYQTLRDPIIQASLWRQSRLSKEINEKIVELKDNKAFFLAECIESVNPPRGPYRTGAIPGLSWHQWGEAIDVFWNLKNAEWDENLEVDGDNGFKNYTRAAARLGLNAGGLWSKPDWGHVHFKKENSPLDIFSYEEINDEMYKIFGYLLKQTYPNKIFVDLSRQENMAEELFIQNNLKISQNYNPILLNEKVSEEYLITSSFYLNRKNINVINFSSRRAASNNENNLYRSDSDLTSYHFDNYPNILYLLRNGGYYYLDQSILDFKHDAVQIQTNDVVLEFYKDVAIELDDNDGSFNGAHRDAIQLIPSNDNAYNYCGGTQYWVSLTGINIYSSKEEHKLQGIAGFDGIFFNIHLTDVNIDVKTKHGITFNGLCSGSLNNVNVQRTYKNKLGQYLTEKNIVLNPIRLSGGIGTIWLVEPFTVDGKKTSFKKIDVDLNTQVNSDIEVTDYRKIYSVDTGLDQGLYDLFLEETSQKKSKPNDVYSGVNIDVLWNVVKNSDAYKTKVYDSESSYLRLVEISKVIRNNLEAGNGTKVN